MSGQLGSGVLDTCQAGCDAAEGTITSPTFTVAHPYIDLLTAGGEHPWGQPNPTSVNLVVNGNVVASVTGNNTPNMDWVHMDASAYIGQQATLQVVDESDGSAGWGHMMVDNIVFSDAIANPWNTETGANLIVDGQVVRTATGSNSGLLDWTSWDLSDLQGKQAQLQLVDLNTGGWGHLLADQFTLADQPALSMTQRAHWLDYGHDFYAAVTFNDAPANQRIALGWMNNWDYANTIPTNGWRGTQSVPRILSLRTIDGQPRIVQKVAPQVTQLAELRQLKVVGPTAIPAGTKVLSATTGENSARLDAVLAAGSAKSFGLQLFRSADGSQYLSVTYDTTTGTLSVDRTHSGNVGFNSAFPSVDGGSCAPGSRTAPPGDLPGQDIRRSLRTGRYDRDHGPDIPAVRQQRHRSLVHGRDSRPGGTHRHTAGQCDGERLQRLGAVPRRCNRLNTAKTSVEDVGGHTQFSTEVSVVRTDASSKPETPHILKCPSAEERTNCEGQRFLAYKPAVGT